MAGFKPNGEWYLHRLFDSDDADESDDDVDVADWTNCPDSENQKRSDIIKKVIKKESLGQLRAILETGWDMNEELNMGYQSSLTLLSYVITYGMDDNNPFKLESPEESVQLLLEHGANPNVTHEVNIGDYEEPTWVHRTALQEATGRGYTDVVKLLCDAGAKCTTSNGLQNPLGLALKHGYCAFDIIKLLLEHGADPNDHNNQTEHIPLLSLIINSTYSHINTTIIQLLLAHGANPNVTHKVDIREDGEAKWVQRSALLEAARKGLTDIVKVLLEAGVKCTMSDASEKPLALALQNEDCPPDLIKLLLEYGADPNDHDGQLKNMPLLSAIINIIDRRDGIKIVHLLLNHGANPHVTHMVNIGGYEEAKWVRWSALHEAASRALTNVVKMLLDAGATSTMSDGSENLLALALTYSSPLQDETCPPDLIKLLLKHGADPNDHDDEVGNVPLLNALKNVSGQDCTTIVKLLLEHGADPHVAHQVNIGKQGEKWVCRTALQQAASQGCIKVVKMLLEAGAKCMTSDGSGNLLALALRCNCNPDLIELLLKHGADPNDHDDQPESIPLLKVIREPRYGSDGIKVIKLLLGHGANANISQKANIQDEVNWVESTALAEAVSQGWTGVVELLLRHGADPNANDNRGGNIPLLNVFVNQELCGTNMVRLLLEYGANPHVTHKVNIGGDGEAKWVRWSALHEAASRAWTDVVKMLLDAGVTWIASDPSQSPLALALRHNKCSPNLISLLVAHGADPNHHEMSVRPVLHRLTKVQKMFLKPELDIFFLKGGNINIEDGRGTCRTALECAFQDRRTNSNSIRWLIRHGANVLLQSSVLKDHFMVPDRGPHGSSFPDTGADVLLQSNVLQEYFLRSHWSSFLDTSIILLHAGMRVSCGAQTQLSKMEVAISTWLQKNTEDGKYHFGIGAEIEAAAMWKDFREAKWEELHQGPGNPKKPSFSNYWTQQMADLQEFSDESLDVYPEYVCINRSIDTGQQCLNTFDEIHRVLEFLSQPQLLHWHCRRSIRENLVSLQPSVVKTLPLPSRLKRYILCHEI